MSFLKKILFSAFVFLSAVFLFSAPAVRAQYGACEGQCDDCPPNAPAGWCVNSGTGQSCAGVGGLYCGQGNNCGCSWACGNCGSADKCTSWYGWGPCDSAGYQARLCAGGTGNWQSILERQACVPIIPSGPTGPSGTPTPSGGGGTPAPTPTPTPHFIGNIYNDPDAVAGGIGGTDNLCVGSTSSSAYSQYTLTATRGTESQTTGISGSSYSINTNTYQNNYTVTLDLPFPPTDPNNPLQCACNADPSDPYRCIYTNQQPSQGLTNFFVKIGAANTAWFQTLGGSSWASGNIESQIPAGTCTPPTCTPALIARDPSGTTDSAGFPLTDTGNIVTSETGDSYIHESGARTNAVQAQGLGVSVPVENYDYFFDKFGDQAQTLPNAGKPITGSDLAIYRYTGNLTLDNTTPWNLANTEQIIVLVNGDLTIDDTPGGQNRITTVASGGDGFLMFVVNGDITVTSDVGYDNIYTNPATANIANVEGVFIADGLFTIAGQSGVTDRKFIGAGTFVGWSGVGLERNFDDGDSPELNNNAATEAFVFRPDFIVNAPRAVKSAQMTWREVEPQF